MWSFQTKLESFLPKNQHTERKLLNFKFWIDCELSKSAKIWLSKSIFYVKNHPKLSPFFFIEEYQLFDKINFSITLLLKWCPIFDSSTLIQNSKFNNFLWVYVDSYAKIFLILYSPLENSTPCIAILTIVKPSESLFTEKHHVLTDPDYMSG